MSSAGSCSGFILSPFGKPQCGYRNGSTRHLPLPWPQRHNVVQSEEALVQPLSLSAGTGWFTTLRSAGTTGEGLGAPAGAVMWAGPGAGSRKAGGDVDLGDTIRTLRSSGLTPPALLDIVLFSEAVLSWVFCGLQTRGSPTNTGPSPVSWSTGQDSGGLFVFPTGTIVVAYLEFSKCSVSDESVWR